MDKQLQHTSAKYSLLLLQKKDMQTLEDRIAEMDLDLLHYQTQTSDTMKKLEDKLRKTQNEANERVATLQNREAKAMEVIKILEDQLSKSRDEARQKRSEMDNQLIHAQNREAKAMEMVKILEDQLSKSRDESRQKRSEMMTLDGKIATLGAKNASLDNQLIQAQIREAEASKVIKGLEDTLSKTRDQLETRQAELVNVNMTLQQRLSSAHQHLTSKVLGHWLHRQLSAAWETWHEHAHYQARMRGVLARIAARWLHQDLAAGFYAWKENSDKQKRAEYLTTRILLHWTHRTTAAALDSWYAHAKEQVG